jgi:hypothetical protein
MMGYNLKELEMDGRTGWNKKQQKENKSISVQKKEHDGENLHLGDKEWYLLFNVYNWLWTLGWSLKLYVYEQICW